MSDRTSASLFGNLFKKFAADPTEQHVRWAHWLWQKRAEGDYDFADYQMYADDALAVLGLARRGVDPENPGDGELWVYGPQETAGS